MMMNYVNFIALMQFSQSWHVFGNLLGESKIKYMKKLFFSAVSALVFMSFTVFQSDLDTIIRSFKSANTAEIAEYFDDYVDMKLLDNDEVKNMSRNQAGIALKRFFSENGVNGFEKISNREIGATMYVAGKLQAANKSYNITILLKQKSNKYQIANIRIN
jgi:hypothetical protein